MTESQLTQLILATVFGFVFLSLILAVAIFIPNPTVFQYQVFRITLALAAAGIAAVIPGVLDVRIPNIATATGALGVFVIVYFYSPAQIVVKEGVPPPAAPEKPPYEQIVNIKLDALALMDKAMDNFADHEEEIQNLIKEIDKAYEHERSGRNNEMLIKMWEILKAGSGIGTDLREEDHDLLGGFLRDWKAKGTLRGAFILEKKRQIAKGLDQLILLEKELDSSSPPAK